jgi:hypothetical protein
MTEQRAATCAYSAHLSHRLILKTNAFAFESVCVDCDLQTQGGEYLLAFSPTHYDVYEWQLKGCGRLKTTWGQKDTRTRMF